MATYCSHDVWFRGRLVRVHCRYNSPQGVSIVKGKLLPELTEVKDIYVSPFFCRNDPTDRINPVFRALFRVLRRQREFSPSGRCYCRFW
jgi:hypothetical protein